MVPVRITRRRLLGGSAAVLLAGRAARPHAASTARIGAIRWDAWQAPGSPTTEAVARSLEPPAWRHRLPFFATLRPDGPPAIDGGTQEVMDREIALAAGAGLGFFAFVAYPRESPMSVGLKLYLASARRGGLGFCLVSELVQWGTAARPSAQLDWHAELMAHPDHLRVKDGRPVYFLGFLTDRLIAERWGGREGLRAGVEAFRARAVRAGAGNPYIVMMARPEPGAAIARDVGADALGAYAIAAPWAGGARYAALTALAERRWEEMAATGLEMVPTAMAGWDRRPRVERPVPWEHWQRPGVGRDKFYAAGTPREIAAHVGRARDVAASHPAAAARLALVYAWNEHDEGGWLAPTIPFDDARLAALRAVLRP
jgi:hypothetical protein